MHKKGITEEVAKKRSRRTVKHQRGIVGADLGAIAALRNQTAAQRASARQAAITKAKTEKKDKEAKKAKPKVRRLDETVVWGCSTTPTGCQAGWRRPEGVEAEHEGQQGWPMSSPSFFSRFCPPCMSMRPTHIHWPHHVYLSVCARSSGLPRLELNRPPRFPVTQARPFESAQTG
jgi:hypothetical protein